MTVDTMNSSSANVPNDGNAVRGPLNALFFTVMDGYLNRLMAERKQKLFSDLPGQVVELGAGVGANFSYMKPGTKVIAVEPNPHMHGGLEKKAAQHGIELGLLANGAEEIDLPDNSVDTVICTLVLCTVAKPEAVLFEVRRILKPGGRFIFLEHVAAPKGHWRRWLQDRLHGVWHFCFEGCHTNRNTAELLQRAGFAAVEIEDYTMRGPFVPVNSQICGTATA